MGNDRWFRHPALIDGKPVSEAALEIARADLPIMLKRLQRNDIDKVAVNCPERLAAG
jgi:hypothetical protein